MRGKGSFGMVWEKSVRITPAYAGKSFPHRFKLGNDQDHPRVCGEKSGGVALKCHTDYSHGQARGFLLPSLACNRTSFTDFGIQV